MKLLQKKSKKGITLVESVIAVALLGFAATGILTMLVASGTKIFQIDNESSSYAEATKRLDMVISAISNTAPQQGSSSDYYEDDGTLDPAALNAALGFTEENELIYKFVAAPAEFPDDSPSYSIRGWYINITYKSATVTGFASNSRGVFDNTGGGT